MIIRSFDDEENGFDLRNYSPISLAGKATISTVNAYTELLNVSGGGFIEIANCFANSNTIKITIDGVVKTFAASGASGFSTDEYVSAATDTTNYPVAKFYNASANKVNAAGVAFCADYTGGVNSYAGLATSVMPIFFNSSLVIAVTVTSTAPADVGYFIRGGLLT